MGRDAGDDEEVRGKDRMKKKIILIGGGGHCKVVIDAALKQEKYEIIGIADIKEKIGECLLGILFVCCDRELEKYYRKGIKLAFISAGSTGNPSLRIKLWQRVKEIGFKFPNIIHPESIASQFAQMGEGNFLGEGAIINAGVRIGNQCIINSGAIVCHDCEISDFVHISPGVMISGGVRIGKYSHIGTGTSIRQCIKIGERTVIGAGSVVLEDMDSNIIAFGNPCKKARKNNV